MAWDLLTIVGKTLLQALAGHEYAALYSAEGQAEVVGNFIVLVSGDMH